MVKFHVIIVGVCVLLSIEHILTHFCSYAFDDTDANTTTADNFRNNLESSISPFITGLIICVVIIVTMVSSLPILRKLYHFVGFYSTHWVAGVLFYLLLLVHGNNHFNPSFWKWLLPVLIIFVLDRIYLLAVLKQNPVDILKAYAYDETSRTIFIEIKKPKRFKYTPGQYIQLNIPQIGKNQ